VKKLLSRKGAKLAKKKFVFFANFAPLREIEDY